jgi:hypothetical protein
MASRQMGKLAKCQVGKMGSYKNGTLAKYQVGKIDKMKWQVGKMAY